MPNSLHRCLLLALPWLAISDLASARSAAPSQAFQARQPPPSWTFTKIVDGSMPIPNRASNFYFDGMPNHCPVPSGDTVLFVGLEYANGPASVGVYKWRSGSLSVVADRSTSLPNHPSLSMHSFGWCSAHGDRILMSYMSPFITSNGLWIAEAGGSSTVATEVTPVPNVPGLSFVPSSLYIAGHRGTVDAYQSVFAAWQPTFLIDGVYARSATGLSVIADTSTPVPGSPGSFSTVSTNGYAAPVTVDGRIVFWGKNQSGQEGLYQWSAGSLSSVVDQSIPVPGGVPGSTFGWLVGWDYDGITTVFANGTNHLGTLGVYREANGTVSAWLPPNVPLPYNGGMMQYVGIVSIDRGRIAAEVWATSGAHILSDLKGWIAPVVSSGMVLDGRVVGSVMMCNQGLADGRIAFSCFFTDGTWGFFIAS